MAERTAGASPLGGLALSWGWARIAALERLGPHLGAAVTRRGRKRAAGEAQRAVRSLERWNGISEKSYSTYQADGNVLRIKRVLDLVEPGDRVLDLGIGFGYVGGVLLRDARIAYYCGTDIKERWLDSARSMLAANGLTERPHHLEVLDLFDLTPEFVARHDPSIVLVLEVLEHVEDPVAALRKIGECIPPGTRVLFTVPILGRLEGVWGHRSVFDVARLQEMCAHAGLAIERVEPVHNVWTMVLARRTADGTGSSSARGRLLAAPLRLVRPGRTKIAAYDFTDVSMTEPAETYRREGDSAQVEIDPRQIGVRCTAAAPADLDGPATAGLRLPIPRPAIVRLELSVDPPGAALAVRASGNDGSGRPRVAWRWGEPTRPPSGERRTHVLKPGEGSPTFVPEKGRRAGDVEWIDVWMELEPGREASLMLHRAAYVPASG